MEVYEIDKGYAREAEVIHDEADTSGVWSQAELCIFEGKEWKELMLRGGIAAFQIEREWWQEVRSEDRMCKECDSGGELGRVPQLSDSWLVHGALCWDRLR